ncbi:MAG: amino acid ABC transporter permease [Rhodospirillaceae bacterium]
MIARPVGWLRANLFSSWLNTLLTLLILWALAGVVPPLLRWALTHAVFSAADSAVCRAADGACWAFITEKYRLILFGTYPYHQQWRPLLAVAVLIALFVVSCDRRTWKRWLLPLWLGGGILVGVLMWGGVLGLDYVENRLWGGLPLTLILSVVGLVVAFPVAVLLALGRRSELPVVRAVSVAYIELIRGVPLVSLLFMAAVMLPMVLPAGMTIDKLLRAQIAFILFAAAYLAEVVRGGLQAIPRGQYEAADALGLGYWQKMATVILPQALAVAIPPIVNTVIAFFKDTSLVIIIGLLDLLSTAKSAISDPGWHGFYRESYLFIAVIYWGFCFSLSRYSQWLERDLKHGHRS